MVYMYHSFLIHSSADGHLGCFLVLAITCFVFCVFFFFVLAIINSARANISFTLKINVFHLDEETGNILE